MADLQADHPESDHCRGAGQFLQFEELVGGDDVVAEGLPGGGNDRARAGSDDDRLGTDALAVLGFQQVGLDETDVAVDQHALGEVVGAVA